MATWEQAREATLERWQELLDKAGTTDPVEFAQEVNSACAFCYKSEGLHLESGRGENRCDFCEGRIQAKGCPKWIPPIVLAAVSEDWDRVKKLIGDTMEEIEMLELPAE